MFYLISRYFSMIVQIVKFPVITTMTRTARTVAQVIAIVSGTDRIDMFYDGPPRKAKKKNNTNDNNKRKCDEIYKWIGP